MVKGNQVAGTHTLSIEEEEEEEEEGGHPVFYLHCYSAIHKHKERESVFVYFTRNHNNQPVLVY